MIGRGMMIDFEHERLKAALAAEISWHKVRAGTYRRDLLCAHPALLMTAGQLEQAAERHEQAVVRLRSLLQPARTAG